MLSEVPASARSVFLKSLALGVAPPSLHRLSSGWRLCFPSLIWVWEWFGEACLLPKKKPRLNNRSSAVAPASPRPGLFPECSRQPLPSGRSPCSQAGALGTLFKHPDRGSTQVREDHSLVYLCLLSSKGAPELWEGASLLLKKRKRDRKMTISCI